VGYFKQFRRGFAGDASRVRSWAHGSSSVSLLLLIAVALTLVLAAVGTASVRSGSYSGSTKQNKKITFSVAKGKVSRIAFTIIDTCPGKRIIEVIIDSTSFPALKLDSKGRFSASIHPPHASNQPTTIKGTINGMNATGSITDASISIRLCHGRTTFTAKRA
jgi:hypothetical protein